MEIKMFSLKKRVKTKLRPEIWQLIGFGQRWIPSTIYIYFGKNSLSRIISDVGSKILDM